MAGAAERAPKLAYAKVGTGPPLVRPAHWLGHLELPFHRHLLLDLAREFKLIRYDARGNGLSDWDVGKLSLDAWVSDLETVVDAAGTHKNSHFLRCRRDARLPLRLRCGIQVASSHLVVFGGFAVGRRPSNTDADRERFAAMTALMKLG